MNLVLSFVGILPKYVIDCIYQARLFYDGDIYLIINDLNSIYINDILKYNIHIIDYMNVKSDIFDNFSIRYINKFAFVKNLKGREELFLRTFERFYLVYNLMKNNNIYDVLFIELDNLIYDDPNKWVKIFSENELCYMYDNIDRFSSGIMYIKSFKSLEVFLDVIKDYIANTKGFISEMGALSKLYDKLSDTKNIQILPTYWESYVEGYNKITYENFYKYNSIFDSAAIGIFLGGMDPCHNKGEIVKGTRWRYSKIDYTNNKFEWFIDDKGRKQPFIWNGDKWILINNLHMHSKVMDTFLSK